MKHFTNSILFLVFLLLFFTKESIFAILNKTVDETVLNTALEISLKNKEQELYDMASNFNINYNFQEKKIYTKLLFQNPFAFFDNITILKGTNDGIEEGSALINSKGLVGIVSKAEKESSVVNLITQKDTKISVKIRNTFGIIESNEQQELWIQNLTNKESIEIGDEIKTSGLTNIPENILIGTVNEIKKDNVGLIQSIKIQTAVDFFDLSYFVVLKKEQPHD